MAVGVVGDSLDEQTPNSEVATFMSRDAGAPQMVVESLHMIGTAVCDGGEVGGGVGRSWIEVDKGSSLYAFSNHGGLMIRAAQFAATSEVAGQPVGAPAAACMHRHTAAAATAPLLPLRRYCHYTAAATAPLLPLHYEDLLTVLSLAGNSDGVCAVRCGFLHQKVCTGAQFRPTHPTQRPAPL